MRLLNIFTQTLEEFFSYLPPYAILSHTWDKEEITFQDLRNGLFKHMAGYKKINSFCQKAAADGFRFVWVDTCCIDKSSSAELSEAINSMYTWYRNSEVCYIYLADVEPITDCVNQYTQVSKCRWLTRGWTLQELIAQPRRKIFDKNWGRIQLGDTDDETADTLSAITGIPNSCLAKYRKAQDYSVAQRLSWAALRQTTREEDMAYCLLGLFDVNMPLLYGEGGTRAFLRLQKQILEQSPDQSVLCWGFGSTLDTKWDWNGALAPSPKAFANCGGIREAARLDMPKWRRSFRKRRISALHTTITNEGILIELSLVPIQGSGKTFLAALPCSNGNYLDNICLLLESNGMVKNSFKRVSDSIPFLILNRYAQNWPRKQIYLTANHQSTEYPIDNYGQFHLGYNPPMGLHHNDTLVEIAQNPTSPDRWTLYGYYPPAIRLTGWSPGDWRYDVHRILIEDGSMHVERRLNPLDYLLMGYSTNYIRHGIALQPLEKPKPDEVVWLAFSKKSMCILCGVQASKNSVMLSQIFEDTQPPNIFRHLLSLKTARVMSIKELEKRYKLHTYELREKHPTAIQIKSDIDSSRGIIGCDWVINLEFVALKPATGRWEDAPSIGLKLEIEEREV